MCRRLIFSVLIASLLVLTRGAYAQCSVAQGQTETVTSTVSCGQMSIAGTLIVESTGSITGTENSTLDGSGATITVNGGSCTINGRFNVGQDSDGYINMNGGTFTVTGTFKFPDDPGGVHRIYLNDGIMHSDDIQMYHDRDAIIYVGAGILRLNTTNPGDPLYDPAEWVNQGALLPAEGYDEIVIEDMGTYTEITALPSGPRVQFETAASEGLESVSPAVLTVTLSNALPGETYTVDYAATGGTAIGGGVDYLLTPGTLTFNPGQMSLPIEFAVINDGMNEDDETVIVELSNPTGPDVALGNRSQHTYMILDPRPGVAFDTPTSSGLEDVTPVNIAVSLSSALGQTATVDYAVTGGTATSGTDYTLLGTGTLTFSAWDVTEYISIEIVDDTAVENYETIELTLSNPSSNVKLTTQDQHTYTIVDNEAGLPWDGLMWYYSDDSSTALFVNASGQLEWNPEKDEQFITRLPDRSLSQVGDIVEFTYWWMSDGEGHESHPECEIGCQRNDEGCPCDYDDDIQCLAGTSDFRVGLFEADGEYITTDGFDVYGSSIFVGYKGYGWRFGPHMDSYPTRWLDCAEEVHKTGQFQKKPVSLSNLLSTNDGLSGNNNPIPGFELPPREWSLFTIRLERLSSSSVELSITLNDRTYTWTDGSSSDQPQKIDVLAVTMRNGRPYTRLVLDTVWQPPPQAWDPSPPDGAEGQAVDVVLTWQPGLNMGNHPGDKHYIYFGTSYDDVNNAVVGSPEYCCFRPVGWEQFDPNSDMGVTIQLWQTYYWRIDEKPFGESTVKGQPWSFAVKEYVLLDDMESYNLDTNIITDTWKESPYPDSDNGAFVLLEETIVHGGQKAMEFWFGTIFGTYFTATRQYSAAQDWTVAGVNHLSLWFYGYRHKLADDHIYVTLKDGTGHSATKPYDGEPNNITLEEWQEWNIFLQEFSDGDVNLTDVREVVIGAESLYWAGLLYFDDIRLYVPRCIPDFQPAGDITGDCFVNFEDYAALASQWLQSPGSPSADIAPDPPDAFVNILDLAVLADGWLEGILLP